MKVDPRLPLTGRIEAAGGLVDLDAYEAAGGYAAAREAIAAGSPEAVIETVKDAKLRGRGGAGFPAGVKWGFVPREAPGTKYLVCNADEMEPGTFKDRQLLEYDPHLLLEGMILAAFAIGADVAYVFLRGEYVQAARRLEEAIAAARERGYLGPKAFEGRFSLELSVHRSAGRYLCGEETALLSALEGERAIPRSKPPFPPASGAWGRPTIVNNVETLCNVPAILREGADWYRGLGRGEDAGTKLFGVSGRVRRPGLWELPMGTTLRELIEEHAGGMQPGYGFRALLPGGASTDFLVAEHLDVPMEYEAIAAAGSRLGTGTVMVMDDRVCPVAFALNLQRFFARESCGFCTPCREGLPWLVSLLEDIEAGRGEPGDLDVLARNADFIGTPGHTFCLHATGAMEPLTSGLRFFREDFEEHLATGVCRYGAP